MFERINRNLRRVAFAEMTYHQRKQVVDERKEAESRIAEHHKWYEEEQRKKKSKVKRDKARKKRNALRKAKKR